MTDVQEILNILGTKNIAHVVLEPKDGATLPYVAIHRAQPYKRVAVSQKSYEALMKMGATMREASSPNPNIERPCVGCGRLISAMKGLRCERCRKSA